MSILELKNVTQKKNGTTILKGITVSFEPSRITAILGRSGSGKTTLLRLLNGLDSPVEGEVNFKGKNITDVPPIQLRRDIGMIFQVPSMFEGSVFENISAGLRLHATHSAADVPDDQNLEKKCRKFLDFVGLDVSLFDKDARTLSVGEKQRLAIARALANEPEVLLMDEPSSALDRRSMLAIEELVKKLRDEGMSLIMVTHNAPQARRLSDYVVVLEGGELKAEGPPSEIFQSTENEEFFGGCCHD